MARGRLWTVHGLLEGLRLKCATLARLKHEASSSNTGGYKNLEQSADAPDLEAMRATLCPLEREAMLEAAGRLVAFYRLTAPPLATRHGIAYPAELEVVAVDKLRLWCGLRVDTRNTKG